jgi:hypothetical protein
MTRTVGVRVGIALLLVMASPVLAVEGPVLTGVVLDPLGSVIREAEIFLLTEAANRSPVAVAHSGHDGRFLVTDLAPGVYRVAAVKEGYRLYLGRINTALRSTLSVVLQPIPSPDSPDAPVLPEDSTWVLQLPERSILRETEATATDAVEAASVDDVRPSTVIPAQVLQGNVDHSFAVAAPGMAQASHAVEGSDTRMALRSLLGERYLIRLDGRRESLRSLATVDDSDDQEQVSRRDRTSLGVGFRYQATPDADLRLRAYYAEHEHATVPGTAGEALDAIESARSWGYDAGWSQRLDAASRLDVTMDYRDAAMVSPLGWVSAPGRVVEPGSDPVSARSFGAGWRYETLPWDRHLMSVSFRAQYLDGPMVAIGGPADNGVGNGVAGSGWTVRADAEDRWSLTGPITLLYGLGYRHTISANDTSVVVPKVGGAWSSRFVNVKVMASYYSLQTWDGEPGLGFSPRMQEVLRDAFGLDAEVETFLARGLSLRGTYSSAPVQFDHVAYTTGGLSRLDRPIYVTDGNAANQDVSVALIRHAPDAQVYFRYGTGRATGTLAAVSADELPVQMLTEASLRYHGGGVGVQVPTAGTDVGVEFRRQREMPLDAADSGEQMLQRLIELRLLQDFLRMRGGVSWRFLFAVQLLERRSPEAAGRKVAYAADTAVASHHRLNAGISLAF